MKTSKHSGGRTRTGTLVRTRDGRWQGIVTLEDGSRKRLPRFPAGTSEAMAREKTAAASKLYAKRGVKSGAKQTSAAQKARLVVGARKSCEAWVEAWHADSVARGLTSACIGLGHWTHHIAAVLGDKHPRDWTRDDYRRLSAVLDEKIQAGDIGWKTAQNIWATATKLGDDAANSKLESLRCRDDNPSDGVRGPDRGARTALQYLYPSEFSRFVECEAVPLEWRRMATIGICTFMRVGELHALLWSDVDLEDGTIAVTKSIEGRTGALKSTKSKSPRLIPIEPELLPLLQAMREESDGYSPVLARLSRKHLSEALRRFLMAAGVDRPALHHRGPGVAPIRFHDLRSTGITWSAVRGDDPLKIQQRAGHSSLDTTQRYLREAEVLRGGFGKPFPALPTSLFRSQESIAEDSEPESVHRERTCERSERVQLAGRVHGATRPSRGEGAPAGRSEPSHLSVPEPRIRKRVAKRRETLGSGSASRRFATVRYAAWTIGERLAGWRPRRSRARG